MNDQPKSFWRRDILPGLPLFSWPRRFLRWLFSWRGMRRMLIILAWTATVVALLYGIENWRGARAWSKYRQGLEARGEQLDLKTFIPKPVPDEQNFAAIPFIETWFSQRTNQKRWEDNYSQAVGHISSSKVQEKGSRRFTDLVAWEMAFVALRSGETNLERLEKLETAKLDPESRARAAPFVLEGLKPSEANLGQLRAVSGRPLSRYPVVYDLENPWGILLPHLASIKTACGRLQLKACAELASGQSAKAFEDVKLMFHLAESVKEEPFLISYLVRLACVHLAMQPIWEGLAEHRWSDAQLQQLQSRLQQYNFLADLKRPMDSERAAGILTVDLIKKKGLAYLVDIGETASSVPESHTVAKLISPFIPRGWYYQEQLNYCRLFEAQQKGTIDPIEKRVSPKQSQSNDKELQRQLASGRLGRSKAIIYHRVMAGLLLPALGNVTRRPAVAQTVTDQAALACALERYRLAHGQLPEKLDGLVPVFIPKLPHDIITGEPYKYRRSDDARVLLYSVGWNEQDDGGLPGKVLFDEKEGDWVWAYPSTQSKVSYE